MDSSGGSLISNFVPDHCTDSQNLATVFPPTSLHVAEEDRCIVAFIHPFSPPDSEIEFALNKSLDYALFKFTSSMNNYFHILLRSK